MQIFHECANYGVIINHLPNEEHITDYYKLYQIAVVRWGWRVHEHFRLAYHLNRDFMKCKCHIDYIN